MSSSFISAVFDTRERADGAIEALADAGFGPDERSVVTSHTTRQPGEVTEGTVVGAASGIATGALAAGLVGVASALVPGLGLFAAGPILAALIGGGLGGAAGGLVATLIGLGASEGEATLVDERLREGGILVGAHATGERRNLALELLRREGGESFKNE